MKILIKMNGNEMSFTTRNDIDHDDRDELDDTTTPEAVEAFKHLLACAGYQKKSIEKAFLEIENY